MVSLYANMSHAHSSENDDVTGRSLNKNGDILQKFSFHLGKFLFVHI